MKTTTTTIPYLRLHVAALGLLLLTFLLLCRSVCHAQTWDGTFTETITASDNPAYQIGQQFTGSYSYTSATADGVFYSTEYTENFDPPGSNDTLTGIVPIGLPLGELNYIPDDYSVTDYPIIDTEYRNFLTVQNGVVTAFDWQDQIGWSDPWFGEGPVSGLNFEFYTGGPAYSVVTGTLDFTAPVDPPDAAVPDRAPTWMLLVEGGALLWLLLYAQTVWGREPKAKGAL